MEQVQRTVITPDMARELLSYNTHNRRSRSRVVSAYAADMIAGTWRWNGESIKFGKDGVLLDGQHRLLAVIEADVPVSMLVIRGLEADTQETIDGGAKRKFSDLLQLRGETNFTSLAAITRAVNTWEAGFRRIGANYAPTHSQLLLTLEKYPWLREIAHDVAKVAKGCGLTPTVSGLCWWLFAQLDDDDARFFFDRLADGQYLQQGDAVYELRRAIKSTESVRGERSAVYMTAITIKAWNAFRDGKPVGQLKFRPGGANPERFPEPR